MSQQNCSGAALRCEDIITLGQRGRSEFTSRSFTKTKTAFRSCNLRAEACLNAVAAALRREDINTLGQCGRSEFISRSFTKTKTSI